MGTMTFDTLKFANTLKAAGVPPAQAEAEARALFDVLEINLRDLAAKEDLHREIEFLCRDMDARFIQTGQRLVIRLGGLMALSFGFIAVLVKLL